MNTGYSRLKCLLPQNPEDLFPLGFKKGNMVISHYSLLCQAGRCYQAAVACLGEPAWFDFGGVSRRFLPNESRNSSVASETAGPASKSHEPYVSGTVTQGDNGG